MSRPLHWIVVGFSLLIWFAGVGIWRQVHAGTDRAAGAIEPAPEPALRIRRDAELEALLDRPKLATSAHGVVLLGAVPLDEYRRDADLAGLLADDEPKPL